MVNLLLKGGTPLKIQNGMHDDAVEAAWLEGHDSLTTLLSGIRTDVTAQGGIYGNAL